MSLELNVLLCFTILIISCGVSRSLDRKDGEIASSNTMITPELFQEDTAVKARVKRYATRNKNKLWPDGIVYYRIHSDLERYRGKIEAAMEEFQNETCIRFIEKYSNYIFASDYIEIIYGTDCSCKIGRQRGRQQLSLGPGCMYHGVILHELMHALGFEHMHTNHNRDKYIKINWHNIKEGRERWFKIQRPDKYEMFTFDFSSIMMYHATSFSKDGSPTMEHKFGGKLPGHENGHLSNNDLYYINKLYNCSRADLSLQDTMSTIIY